MFKGLPSKDPNRSVVQAAAKGLKEGQVGTHPPPGRSNNLQTTAQHTGTEAATDDAEGPEYV